MLITHKHQLKVIKNDHERKTESDTTKYKVLHVELAKMEDSQIEEQE